MAGVESAGGKPSNSSLRGLKSGRVLVLGGTGEARDLAAVLVDAGIDFLSSLAGRVKNPRLPVGDVRVGGFGGVAGLAAYLTDNGISAVIDATHPFAAGISANAVSACAAANVPLLRLARPGWSADEHADSWHWVDDHDQAAWQARMLGDRVLLTTGRQALSSFVPALADRYVLARVVDAPEIEIPSPWEIVADRGPYNLAGETELMTSRGIDVLVTKDSGGSYTQPKLDAADRLGVAVVIVRRPAYPEAVQAVDNVRDAVMWVRDFGEFSAREI